MPNRPPFRKPSKRHAPRPGDGPSRRSLETRGHEARGHESRGHESRGREDAYRDINKDGMKIAGLAAVEALFARNPAAIERLFFTDEFKNHLAPLCRALSEARKPYRLVDAEELARIAGTKLNGGVVAQCRPLAVTPFESRMAAAWAEDGRPLLILDGVGNPHNLGAIVRTMAFFGLPRLLISSHREQAAISEAAVRVSEGGLIWTDLFRATQIVDALHHLRKHYLVAGTALGRGTTLGRLKRDRRPLAFVLGNEELGLPEATQKACEALITLPGSGRVQSLNVAATAAILVHYAAESGKGGA